MRLITRRKVYRAFPELDRFDEERCERFVRAAKRGRWRYVRGLAAQIVVAVVAFALAGVVLGAVLRVDKTSWFELGSRGGFFFLALLWIVGLFGAAGLAALWVRDFLLRRRIGKVVRERGVCLGCRYVLVGLFVDEHNRVRCPECGEETQVDPSLGELAGGADGRARFEPKPDLLSGTPRWMTSARARWLKRWSLRSVLAIVLLIGLMLGGYEGFLRWQAGVARRERPGPVGMQAIFERGLPAASAADGSDAWELLRALEQERRDIENRTPLPDAGEEIGERARPEYYYVGLHGPPEYLQNDAASQAHYKIQREAAYIMLRAYREAGLFERAEGLAKTQRGLLPLMYAPTQSAAEGLIGTEWGETRNWARIQAGRMDLAREVDDPDEFAGGLETALALAWMLRMRPLMIDNSLAAAIDALAHVRAKDALARGEKKWIDAVEGVLDREKPSPDFVRTLDGEEAFVLDTTAWMFADPARVRLGRYSKEVQPQTPWSEELTGRLGSYAANRDEIKALFAAYRDRAREEPGRRGPTSSMKTSELMLVRPIETALQRSLSVNDFAELDRRGLRVIIAIERYKLDAGHYPAALDELVPRYLAAPVMDPWSGTGLRYRLIDPAADKQKRGYLLYSIGSDKKDDGGVNAAYPGTYPQPILGSDLILNDRGW